VRCFQHSMFLAVDQRAFFPRAGTPEQKNDVLALFVDGADNGVGEFLPAFALMRAGPGLLHGQRRIQQQYPLRRPPRQVAMERHLDRVLAFDLLVDILKARWNGDALADREAKALPAPLRDRDPDR
jgi:hypothetical protein